MAMLTALVLGLIAALVIAFAPTPIGLTGLGIAFAITWAVAIHEYRRFGPPRLDVSERDD